MAEKRLVLMRKTLQPRLGKRLLEGEIYPLPVEMAEQLERTNRGEIIQDLPTEDDDEAIE